jgi:hypothetical protein
MSSAGGTAWLTDQALWLTYLDPADALSDPLGLAVRVPSQDRSPARRGVNLRIIFPALGRKARPVPTDPQPTRSRRRLAPLPSFLSGHASVVDVGRGRPAAGPDVVYVAGDAFSADFPTSSRAYDTTHNGGFDTFVAALRVAGATPAPG